MHNSSQFRESWGLYHNVPSHLSDEIRRTIEQPMLEGTFERLSSSAFFGGKREPRWNYLAPCPIASWKCPVLGILPSPSGGCSVTEHSHYKKKEKEKKSFVCNLCRRAIVHKLWALFFLTSSYPPLYPMRMLRFIFY